MELTFEEFDVIGEGKYPDFVQFERTEGEIFFIDDGLLYGTPTEKLNGYFDNPVWQGTHKITPEGDTALRHFEVDALSGFGLISRICFSDVV